MLEPSAAAPGCASKEQGTVRTGMQAGSCGLRSPSYFLTPMPQTPKLTFTLIKQHLNYPTQEKDFLEFRGTDNSAEFLLSIFDVLFDESYLSSISMFYE